MPSLCEPLKLLPLIALLFLSTAAGGAPLTAEIDPAQRAPLIGETVLATISGGETLIELARREGLGYLSVIRANPEIDPWLPEAGRLVVLPTAAILPYPLLEGITINLAELRLYFTFRDKGRVRVRIYPIAIGSEANQTPEGQFTVARKIVNPSWTVPPDIRRDRPELPGVVPPGPDNPLGEFWIGLSDTGYGIHGTNEPFGVGRRASHGCIRLYPEDIRDLYPRVKVGTPVQIYYQPIKLGLKDGHLLAEVHTDFLGRLGGSLTEFIRQKRLLNWQGSLDVDRAQDLLEDPRGIPVVLSSFTLPAQGRTRRISRRGR